MESTQIPTPPAPDPAPAPAAEQVVQPPAPTEPSPVQVEESVFLAARLRETLAEAANLRQLVAELQLENSRLRAAQDQAEINNLDSTYDVGAGTRLLRRQDGTYWRLPKEEAKKVQ